MSFLYFYLVFALVTGYAAHHFFNRISQQNLDILVMSEDMPEVFANKKAMVVLLAVLWPLAGPALLASCQP